MTTVFILGGAASVWADFAAACEIAHPHLVIATNDAGALAESVDHWCTLHPEKFQEWSSQRSSAGLAPAGAIWFHKEQRASLQGTGYVEHKITEDWGGSSGLFAVKVALELGVDKIILCGVPMTAQGAHFFDDAEWRWSGRYQTGWTNHLPDIADKVRSVSGWTEQLLGRPDRVWLNRKDNASGDQINS